MFYRCPDIVSLPNWHKTKLFSCENTIKKCKIVNVDVVTADVSNLRKQSSVCSPIRWGCSWWSFSSFVSGAIGTTGGGVMWTPSSRLHPSAVHFSLEPYNIINCILASTDRVNVRKGTYKTCSMLISDTKCNSYIATI